MSTTPTASRSRPKTIEQEGVLEYLISYVEEHGYQPSLREIAAHRGRAGATNGTYQMIASLARQGFIAIGGPDDGKPRLGTRSRAIRIIRLPDGSTFKGFSRNK